MIAKLEQAVRINHRPPLRPKTDNKPAYPEQLLTYRGNVANAKARSFYQEHGVGKIEAALEAGGKLQPGQPVMITKYCLKVRDGLVSFEATSETGSPRTFLFAGKERSVFAEIRL